jgi:hypothetical protein
MAHVMLESSGTSKRSRRVAGQPGFKFESVGLGSFSVTLPDIFENNNGSSAQPDSDRLTQGIRIFDAGTFTTDAITDKGELHHGSN